MKDLFGLEIDQTTKFALFHDESDCNKSNFLYHGFLFVRNNNGREILNGLINKKKNNNCDGREIHFSELNQHSESPHGRKTKVALDWLNLVTEKSEKDRIKFYLFGVNKNNIKNFWSNPNDYNKNVYLNFFEIGLKSAIRWFNLDKVTHTFLDSGRHDRDRQNIIYWLNYNFFKSKFSHKIEPNNVKSLSSDEVESKSEFSNFLQLADVLLGVSRSCFVELGDNQKGQKECVENFIDIIERFNNKKKAYNKNSKYYKKFCIGFYPTKNSITKDEFLSDDIESLLKRGNFYCDRKTYRQQLADSKNLKLF